MSRTMLFLIVGWALFSFSDITTSGRAETPSRNIGKKIRGFTLPDTRSRAILLSDFKEKKAIVVVFIGTQCPINNATLPYLTDMHQAYAAKGVQFLAINSNRQDSMAAVVAHASKFAIPFPVLKDQRQTVADLFGARRTPEAFVLDATAMIRYQGRISDQFGIGYQRPAPKLHDLAEAIDDVLAGKEVRRPTTPVAGCLISRAASPKIDGTVTFTRDIAPILQKNCQECHRRGQIGPMPLISYEGVTAWADTIREVIEERRMPPWDADPRYGKFSNDRRLTARERQTLLAWLDQGTPQGDERDMPPPRAFVEGWTIGTPDAEIDMGVEFEVPAKMPKDGIPYKYFFVNTGFTNDRWVTRAEAKAGAPEVVHHVIIFVVPPGQRFFPGNPATPALAGTAPGDMQIILPPGTAKKVPAHSQFVFQMHYTPNGKRQKDKSRVGLIFAKESVRRPVYTEPIANLSFRIPPGAHNYKVEARFPFERDGQILAVMPHMHLRGKDFQYEAVYPDGRREILLFVPRYNFNWQTGYRFADPVAMPKGSEVRCIAHFDNSAKNPSNPDPSKGVVWGDQTWEEMMIGWIDFTYDR